MEAQRTLNRVRAAVENGARFYVSHSGGKDSQAMYAIVRELVPHQQIVVVHANLGRHEWTGIEKHIRANIAHALHVVRAHKTFSDMVRHRAKTRPDVPSFPSANQRQCTSDLKRGPIYKFIRRTLERAQEDARNQLHGTASRREPGTTAVAKTGGSTAP